MVPYRPRVTGPLGIRPLAGWQVKIIGITAGRDLPGDPEVEAACRIAEGWLPVPARSPARHGVAFMIVHRGEEALWVQLAWWELDMLHHRLFRAALGTVDLRRVPADGPAACVWELLVIDHERRAWVAHVLQRPDDPDLNAYLADTLRVARVSRALW